MKKYTTTQLLLLICLFMNSVLTYSQTKDPVVVTVDLEAGTIGKVPFDQPFKLSSFKTVYDKITLKYELINAANVRPNYNKGGEVVFRVDKLTGTASCTQFIKPLHPNLLYRFTFTATKAIDLTETEETAYRKDVFQLINATFKNVQNQDIARIEKFKGDLENILIEYAKSDYFVDSSGNLIDVKKLPLFKNSLNTSITNIEKNYFLLETRIPGNINTAQRNSINHFKTGPDNIIFFKKLSKAIQDEKLISSSFKTLLDNPINPSLSANATLTLRQYLQYLLEDPIVKIEELLNGTKKIVGNDHDATNQVDKNSLVILDKVFELLNRSGVTNSKGKAYFSTDEKTFIGRSSYELETYIDALTNKENAIAEIALEEKTIPNLLKDAFVKKEIAIESSADIDVLAEKNPYIGLDSGVAYAFGSVDGLFIYEGANFYLRPINRDANFSDLQGWDEFYKRFSIYIGIAQLVTEKKDSYESLFSNSSVLVGAGLRLNRAFKINVGGLLHYKKDANPIIDDKKITFSPTVSLSVDIDLTKALGAVGEALNIK